MVGSVVLSLLALAVIIGSMPAGASDDENGQPGIASDPDELTRDVPAGPDHDEDEQASVVPPKPAK